MTSAIKKTAAILLVLTMVCSLLAGCGGKKSGAAPEDTVEALEQAINSADMDAVLACMSSTLVSRIEPLLALAVGEDGMSVGSVMNLVRTALPMIPAMSNGLIQAEDLPRIDLTAEKTEQEDNRAEVSVTGVLSCGDFSKSFSTVLRMQPEDSAWVITGIA